MSVTVLFKATIQADKVEELWSALRSALPATRGFKGCEGLTVHQGQDDPTDVVMLEKWASRSDHEAYMAWRQSEPANSSGMGGLLSGPPSVVYLNDIDV